MISRLGIDDFIVAAQNYPVLDVRSPGEFNRAHIPNACSFPLFSDEERKVVGTIYKQQGRQPAIKAGLDFFGVKMRKMVEDAEAMSKAWSRVSDGNSQVSPIMSNGSKPVMLVHCWRGGMRSAGVAWLLDLYGFDVYTLSGGYKSFRNWALQQFDKQYAFQIIGGYTGSGKTDMLKELAARGHTILNLEALANHKGSAFGDLGEEPQPGVEMFENQLAVTLHHIAAKDPIWIEDESRRIGDLNLPLALWTTMRQAPVFFVEVPFEERLNYITTSYGRFKKEDLVNAIMRIRKRLGGLNAKNAIGYLLEGNEREAFRILLEYYDKYYTRSLHERQDLDELLTRIRCEGVDATKNVIAVLQSMTARKDAQSL